MIEIREIMNLLPIPTVLLVTGLSKWNSKSGSWIKNVTYNEPFFPVTSRQPVMPGVLIVRHGSRLPESSPSNRFPRSTRKARLLSGNR
jgi:3-hydroxymyristoyl/3-hydroxydecanoyl-(acyl carrier protein) dehydratase